MINKPISLLVLAGFLCINATRCSSDTGNNNSAGKIKLTKEWSPNMYVQVSYSGGMVNESRRIDISADSAVYEVHEDHITERFHLNFSKEELNKMAAVFYENDFPRIKSSPREGTLYDAPSSSVLLCIGSDCINQGDDAYSVYTGSNAQRIKNVSEYVWGAGNKKLNELKIPFVVEISDELLKGKDDVHYQVAPGGISYSTSYNGRNDREEYKILPGQVSITANTITKDSTNRVLYPLTAMADFNTINGTTIHISLKNGQLHIEQKK